MTKVLCVCAVDGVYDLQ